jgi:hypothetical protein
VTIEYSAEHRTAVQKAMVEEWIQAQVVDNFALTIGEGLVAVHGDRSTFASATGLPYATVIFRARCRPRWLKCDL